MAASRHDGGSVARRCLLALVVLFALSSAQTSPARAATPEVLFKAPGLFSMSAGGGRIGWLRLHPQPTCFGYTVWVRDDATGAVQRVHRCVDGSWAQQPTRMLGVTPTRVYWEDYFESPGNETDEGVGRAPATPGRYWVDGLTLSCGGNGCTNCGGLGDTLAASDTEGGDLIYATTSWDGDPSNCGGENGGGKVVSGGSVRRGPPSGPKVVLGTAPGASLLAAANGRFAELPLVPGGPAEPDIEVRSATDGSLVSTIHPAGLTTGLAMSRLGVVAEVNASGNNTLRLYDPLTGALIRSVVVQPTARLVNASGKRALYTVGGRTIRTLNLESGRTHLIYTTLRHPYDLWLDGRLVVWHTRPSTVASRTVDVVGIRLTPL